MERGRFVGSDRQGAITKWEGNQLKIIEMLMSDYDYTKLNQIGSKTKDSSPELGN